MMALSSAGGLVLSASGTGGGSLDDPVALNMLGRRTGRRWATSRDGERCRARHVRRECSCETASLGVTPTSLKSQQVGKAAVFFGHPMWGERGRSKRCFPTWHREKETVCESFGRSCRGCRPRGRPPGRRLARPSKWLPMQS